jgi:uncharacterized protein (DUF1697 family)
VSAAQHRRWFAFLRAVNTGNRRLTNETLLAPLAQLGVRDVAAYQAAGNVTFVTDGDREPAELEARLEVALADAHGFEVPTFVRSADELTAAIDPLPFAAAQLAVTEGRVQITFLRDEPAPDAVTAALALVPDDDAVVFGDRHWLWLPRTGISGSELAVGRIEGLVGPMTTRTVGTVERMLARFGDRETPSNS